MSEIQRLQQISQLMQNFRLAAETEHIMRNYVGYARFPISSCTWASFALGILLQESEPERHWYIVSGSNADPCDNHDWLEDGEIAVDITADQYPPMTPYIGITPPPAARTRPRREQIELSQADPPHIAALNDIRSLMKGK